MYIFFFVYVQNVLDLLCSCWWTCQLQVFFLVFFYFIKILSVEYRRKRFSKKKNISQQTNENWIVLWGSLNKISNVFLYLWIVLKLKEKWERPTSWINVYWQSALMLSMHAVQFYKLHWRNNCWWFLSEQKIIKQYLWVLKKSSIKWLKYNSTQMSNNRISHQN